MNKFREEEFHRTGYLTVKELNELGILPPRELIEKKRVAVIECIQEIACNACAYDCRVNAIKKEHICKPPVVSWDECVGCKQCVGVCPGLAIFCIQIKNGRGYVSMPYEMLPEPRVNCKVRLLDREGRELGEGKIVEAYHSIKGDPGWTVTIEFQDPELVYEVRAFKVLKGEG